MFVTVDANNIYYNILDDEDREKYSYEFIKYLVNYYGDGVEWVYDILTYWSEHDNVYAASIYTGVDITAALEDIYLNNCEEAEDDIEITDEKLKEFFEDYTLEDDELALIQDVFEEEGYKLDVTNYGAVAVLDLETPYG